MSGAPAEVWLNIYNLGELNSYISPFGIGFFHTGLEVHGTEYSFSGHPYHISGIFEIPPKEDRSLGKNFQFRESLFLGVTNYTDGEVRAIVSSMNAHFTGKKYHWILRNCNHFTNTLAKSLTGGGIPKNINRLAKIASKIPCIRKRLPRHWLLPKERPFLPTQYGLAKPVSSTKEAYMDAWDTKKLGLPLM